MKKLVFLILTIVVLVSCKKEEVEPQVITLPIGEEVFQITDLSNSLWILKGRFKDGVYVATLADECPSCNYETGFVLNYKQDTIPYNKGKYYTYHRSTIDQSDNQGAGYWMPVDSIFNGWPTGNSDYFQEYTIISINKDSLVVDDGTPFTANGELSVYMNRSELLIYE